MATRKKSQLGQEITEQEQTHESAIVNTGALDRDISDYQEEPGAESADQEPSADASGDSDISNYPDMGENFAGNEDADGEPVVTDETSLNLDELLCDMDQAQEESEAEADSPAVNTETPLPKQTARRKKTEPETDGKDTEAAAGDKNTEPITEPMEYVVSESGTSLEPEDIDVPALERTSVPEPSSASEPVPAPLVPLVPADQRHRF